MANTESTFKNMLLSLFLITAFCTLILSIVFKLTEEPIAAAKANKLKMAINMVVPGAETAEIEEKILEASDGTGNLTAYYVRSEGQLIGTAIKTYSNKGFSGEIIVMVGFDADGNIIDSDLLEHKETPGLGNKAQKSVSDWNFQFMGKNPSDFSLKVKSDGGSTDAITAATITSRAYCDALQRAYDTYLSSVDNDDSNKAIKQDTQNNMEELNNE